MERTPSLCGIGITRFPEAVGEVLRAVNGEGVYVPAAAKDEKRNLSDDAALDAALAIWAQQDLRRR